MEYICLFKNGLSVERNKSMKKKNYNNESTTLYDGVHSLLCSILMSIDIVCTTPYCK